MINLVKQLTLKYSFLQGTYWISQCVIGGFAAVFLRSKNFSNTQIGIVLSLSLVLSIILQLLVSAFADKVKKISLRNIVMVLMFFVFALAFVLWIAPSSFMLIAIIFILILAIQSTLIPLLNALAVEYINKGISMNYGLARGMGSISFAIASYILGIYVANFGPSNLISIFLFCYCFLILSTFVYKVKIPKSTLPAAKINDKHTSNEMGENGLNSKEQQTASATGIVGFFLKYKIFSLHLIGIAMLFYSHNIINTYLINIIENVGGNSTDMGISLAIAAAVELPIMAAFIFLVRKFKCNTLIKISAFFFVVKVGILWLAPNVYVVHISQALQMFAYALYTPASVFYVNSIIEEQDKVKGQTMVGVAMCVAGTIANISGGKILDTIGVGDLLFLGTIVTAIGFIIICASTIKVTLSDNSAEV